MFIERAQVLSLLAPDVETNILKDFSLPVRKILVQQVVTFLLTGDNALQTLVSPAHVVWSLETCGQGFALPMEEEDSIVKVINLYRRWTLDPEKRPAPIEKDQQFFIQKMLQHFSMLFEPRANGKGEVEKHARLCSQVLDIFANIGRQIGSTLSVETWEIFLKLLIAVTDTVLGVDAPVRQEVLQRKLCPQLLKVLFELWLLSGTRNPALWDALRQSVKGWTHHMSLILTWKVTCFALTKRSTAILYGSSEGTDCVIVKIDDSVQNIQLDDEYVFYSWHRMLNIIGNPSEVIQHPAIFLAFMNGVEILVNQYLKIGYASKVAGKDGNRFLPPDGNTILHIFGTWLYDAIQFDRSGFDEGTALAMKILCNIMTTKHRTDFLPIYMASFYSCMQEALMKEERVLLAAITSATNLFTLEIKGLRCLVPSFIYAIHKVITKRAKPFDSVMPAEHVRRACLTLLSTLLPLPNHFGDTKFALPITDPAAKAFDVKQYMDLKAHFSMILSEALSNETYPPNLEILLNLAATWGLEEIENSSEFIKQAISLIVRKTTSSSGWPAEVALIAIKVLSAMNSMYPKLEKGYDQANVIVGNLCKYVSGLLSAGQPQATEELIVHSFKCITDWIMVEQWILEYADTKYMLLHALVLGLTGRPQRQESAPEPQVKAVPETPVKGKKAKKEQKKELEKNKELEKKEPAPMVLSAKIREAAQCALTTLLNQTGNFPSASGASVVSTLAREEDILQEVINYNEGVTAANVKEFMRYYITTDRSIVCAIDRVGEAGTFSCILVRNRYGRYAWDVELQYLPSSFQREAEGTLPEMTVPISTKPFSGVVSEKESGELSSVTSFLENADTKSAISVIEQHVAKEGEVLHASSFNLDHDVSVEVPQPADPYAGECKFQCSRMLLSHLGFLAFENRTMLYPLQMSEDFFSYLRMLDQLPERECIKVGVVFIRKGQSEEDFYSNLGGTLDYQEMVTSLGWGVNVGKHNGFLGTLDRNIQAGQVNTAPYWANHGTEVLFHVATLMPNNMSGSDKRRQVTNVYAMVIWAETMEEFTPQMIWKKVRHNVVLIVISPMPNGLYHVKLFSKNETSGIGPIVDGCVLSKYVLGHLVRDTAISAHRKETHDTETPQQHREQCLQDIYDRFKVDCNLETFYSAQFTKLKTGQVSVLEVADTAATAAATSKYHGGPPSKKSKAGSSAPIGAAPTRAAPASPAPSQVGPGTLKKDKSSGSGFSRITPSRSENKGSSSSWLTMGSRTSSAAAPSSRSQGAASLGGQHRRGAPNEDEEDHKSKKKKSSKKSSKSKKKQAEDDEF
mmetsp:Transcript_2685/g.9507  ORF Transcript_2685/g.9507 Transcript_2685/m.9507 type:complete len:1308 (+) Transcript_2685:68-3991(+)|eukprot:CAMPEP_0114627374 /NCGR_PEP_ID=MMETSP0168-20121206/12263_1 /TAXON_ID=95228 ORGANISM="Vannella sp., Strain DIVA3 517/6/12" /NCGR_SAMPLE_ID=MMETSP0168 /ASSEMBLY_ACC=CAM_ASM_000044 /LENGTH=1307 /DNA_ID=CAMNT_0001838705 /DNA_START=1 /DNA_END=3924 /DNA_ORIENTATION=-